MRRKAIRQATSTLYQQFGLFSGGFTCFGKGDAIDMLIGAWLMEFGKHRLTRLTGLIDGAFCQHHDDLTEFLIGATTY